MAIDLISSPTDSYLSFFLHKPLWDVWNLFLLCLARIVPMIAICPFFGAKVTSDAVKMGFGIAIAPIFFPYILSQAHGPIPIDILYFFLLIKEAIIGAILGFIATIPFYFTNDAGSLIDHQRGSQSLQVTDPMTQVQASPIGLLYSQVMLPIFFYVGGPFIFFEAVYHSYQVIPADQFFHPAFFNLDNPLWVFIIKLLNAMFTIALQLSAPSLLALLMTDLFLGIANRMAPQVQISFLLWSLKAYVGIAVLWMAWWLIFKQMEIEGLNWIKLLDHLVQKI